MKQSLFILILAAALSISLSCGKTSENGAAALALHGLIDDTDYPESREFYLGLSPFPFDMSGVDKVEWMYEKIESDADLIAQHFDNGIP